MTLNLRLINSLKICDPAVGSGHFLVSALNEIIAIKSELQVLVDREGNLLTNYDVEVVNDELIVTNVEGELFEYHPANINLKYLRPISHLARGLALMTLVAICLPVGHQEDTV